MVMMEPSAVRVTSRCTPPLVGGGGGGSWVLAGRERQGDQNAQPQAQDTAVRAAGVLDSFMFVYLNLFIQSIPTDSRLKSKYISLCTRW